MKDIISETFGLPAIIEPNSNNEIVIPEENINPRVDQDFYKAREHIIDVIEVASAAIDEIADLAEKSQNARYYESLSSLLKTKIDAAQQLMNSHKQHQDIVKKIKNPHSTQNNLFIGTSEEVLKMIKAKIKEN